jgi:hypothetical protein
VRQTAGLARRSSPGGQRLWFFRRFCREDTGCGTRINSVQAREVFQ